MKLLFLTICIFAYISFTFAISGTLYGASSTCNTNQAETAGFTDITSNQCKGLDMHQYGGELVGIEINCQSDSASSMYTVKVWNSVICNGTYFGTAIGTGDGTSCAVMTNTESSVTGSFIVDCASTSSAYNTSLNFVVLLFCLFFGIISIF